MIYRKKSFFLCGTYDEIKIKTLLELFTFFNLKKLLRKDPIFTVSHFIYFLNSLPTISLKQKIVSAKYFLFKFFKL